MCEFLINCSFFCHTQELILPLLLLGLLVLISTLNPHVYYEGFSTMELEQVHPMFKGLGYTPITNITSHIMEEVAQEMRKCLKYLKHTNVTLFTLFTVIMQHFIHFYSASLCFQTCRIVWRCLPVRRT